MELAANTVLGERFAIRSVLESHDPHVILYSGTDVESAQPVRIYEFFPPLLANRADDKKTIKLTGQTSEDYQFGLRVFKEESENLVALSHDHIPPIIASFDDHGTSYRVRPHSQGTTLQIALEKRAGTLSEEAAQAIFLPIVDALATAHEAGIIHGGISPDAVYLTKDRQTQLQGFRGSSLRIAQRLGQSVELAIPSISPLEQYEVGAEFGIAGDLYCVAASIFQVITGMKLPEAPVRVPAEPIRELTGRTNALSAGMRNVLLHALALNSEDRVQDAATFRGMLADPGEVHPPSYLQATSSFPSGEASEVGDPLSPVEAAEESADEPTFQSALDNAPPPEIPSTEEEQAEPEESVASESPAAEPAVKDEATEPLPANRESALEKGPRTLVISAGIAAVVLIAGVFAILYGSEWLGDRSNEMSQFASLTAEADSLMAENNYSAAQSRYARAKELAKADETEINAYLERRLEEARQREQARKTQEFREMLNEGRAYQVNAASLVAAGAEEEALAQFESAYDAFMAAWDTHPEDSLALDLAYAALNQAEGLAEGNQQSTTEASQDEDPLAETEDRLFEHHIAEAELYLDAGSYEEAQAEFEHALAYRPDDSYTQEQLGQITSLLSEQEREAEFANYVSDGEELRQAGQLSEARQAFQRALSYREDQEIERYITQIDSQLAAEEEAREQFYVHRARGDLLFEEERYADAVSSYQQASAINPDDAHVSSRLEESLQAVAEMQAAEERAEGMRRDDGVYVLTDRDPQLVGSLQELHDRVDYPRQAVRAGIEGRVIMQFVVEEDGTVSEPDVLRGIGGGADEEALRVIQETQFEPAVVDGNPVRAHHTMWIQFRLDNR